jgi:hypothetical protein
MQMAGQDRQFARSARESEQINVFRSAAIFNPHNYPQTRTALAEVGFRLRLAGDPISSLPDRSRLVLPNVTIAKVRLAWMWAQLPASHQVVDLILVPCAGSSTRNVTGGRKLARHDFCGGAGASALG